MAAYGIGAVLKQERVRQGRSLEEVARQTKISARFLEAIESENFDRLPGLVFTRNFIRQYADALKVDSDPLLAELPKAQENSFTVPQARQRIHPGESSWDPRWNSALASVLWFGLALGAAVGAYFYFNRPAQTSAKTIVPPATAPVAKNVVTDTQPRQAPFEPPPTTAAPLISGKPVQVTLTATEPAWVSITEDGKSSFSGTLQPNDRKDFSADSVVRIIAGNAGGLQISLNGKTLDPLGPKGQVRTVRLTAEGPQPGVKNPAAPAATAPAPL